LSFGFGDSVSARQDKMETNVVLLCNVLGNLSTELCIWLLTVAVADSAALFLAYSMASFAR